MITQEMKREFVKMYGEMVRNGFVEHGLTSMGNWAYFVDRCLTKEDSQNLKKIITAYIVSKSNYAKQELFFLIANSVYEYAKKENIAENLDFRMERVIQKKAKKSLNHFDILLDEYDFPEWFKTYIPLIEADEAQKIYYLLIKMIKEKPLFEILMSQRDYVTKTHMFVHQVGNNSFKWQYILALADAYSEGDVETSIKLLEFKLMM